MNDEEDIYINFELSKIRSESDHRNVEKYLESAKERAVSKLNIEPFSYVKGDIGRSTLIIYARCYLKTQVSRQEIQDMCNKLSCAHIAMNLQ